MVNLLMELQTENRLLILLDIAKILSDEEKELLQDIESV